MTEWRTAATQATLHAYHGRPIPVEELTTFSTDSSGGLAWTTGERSRGSLSLVVIAAEKVRRDRPFAIPLIVVTATDFRDRICLVEPSAEVDDAAALAAEGRGDDGVEIDSGTADGATGHGWSPR
jgi:hypothetical protein